MLHCKKCYWHGHFSVLNGNYICPICGGAMKEGESDKPFKRKKIKPKVYKPPDDEALELF